MKVDSDATDRKTRKLLLGAQLLTLAFFALGLAFVWHPTPGTLFLFATLTPVLVPGAVLILTTRWIVDCQRRLTQRAVAHRAPRSYRSAAPVAVGAKRLFRPVPKRTVVSLLEADSFQSRPVSS